MRKHKYRAWDKVDNKMIHWDEMYLQKEHEEQEVSIGYKVNKVVTKFDHDIVLMQWTGLKDRKGIDIYEGDIIKEFEYGTLSVIKWIDNGFKTFKTVEKSYYGEKFIDVVEGRIKQSDDKRWGIEVVGNTFETRDLLDYQMKN